MLLNFELILSLLVPAAVAIKESDKTTTGTTLDHLQEAFNGETNAHYRYLAFAAQADVEGFHQVASLYRATARAEEIHARNHSDVIRMMGAQPKSKIEKPVVKSTRENLQIAMDGEIYERDKMYPPMIEEAKASKHPEAVRTFIYALKTEAEHARLFEGALKNLDKMKETTTYYVCSVCGYTVGSMNFLRCLVCGHSKTDYLAVE
jgi:rubrerythrin